MLCYQLTSALLVQPERPLYDQMRRVMRDRERVAVAT
jgi:hypothetical protein